METTLDPPAGAFRLIARDVIVRSMANSQPTMPVVLADVALVDGRPVARWVSGGAIWYAPLPPDADLAHRRDFDKPRDFDLTTGGASRIDPIGDVDGLVEARGADRWHAVDLRTEADRELAAFMGQWPHIAGMLGLELVDPTRLFDPGYVRAEKPAAGKPLIDFRPFVARHASGDHGELGRHDDTPLTAAEQFALGLQPTAVKNRAAILSGWGTVRSSFRLPDDLQAAFAHPIDRRPAAAEIVTAIVGGRGNQTLCTVGRLAGE